MHSNSTPAPAARCDATHCICVCRQALQRRTHEPPSCALWHIQRPEHAHAALHHSLHSTGRQAQGQSLPRRVTNKAHAEPQFCSGSSSSHARAATAADKYKASAEACRVPGVQQGTSHRSSAATAATSVPGSHRRTCCFQPCVLLMHSTRAATAADKHQGTSEASAARRVSNKAHSALSSAAAAVQLPCHACAAFSAACCSCHAAAG